MFAYVNGSLVDDAAAYISIFDHGFVVGDGVFETIAVRDGKAQWASRRLARLIRSAVRLGLAPPDPDLIEQALDQTLAANPGIGRGALRVTYTSGPGPVGSTRGGVGPTLVVAARELPRPDAMAEVITVPWCRNERGALAGINTTSSAENAMALHDAWRQGATEAIFANIAGNLCEGSGSNIFVVLNGQLLTPPLSVGCLAGVTRALVLERCAVDVEERDIPMEALYLADEAFLTSAIRDVQPIRSVDGRALASCPGAISEKVAEAYAAVLAVGP